MQSLSDRKKVKHKMKKNVFSKIALATALGTAVVAQSKAQDKKDPEQQKIDILYQKLRATKDISTYTMPDSLRHVQRTYNALRATVEKQSAAFDSLISVNWDMYLQAYDKFAVRIGKQFQLSKYFKPWELITLKKLVQEGSLYAPMDYFQQNALARIMNDTASLADLLEFCSDIDFDVIWQHFETKFLPRDSSNEYDDYSHWSPIVFIDDNITKDVNKELMLLSDSWASAYVDKQIYLMKIDRDKLISSLDGTYVATQKKQINEMYLKNKDTFVADFTAENGGLDVPNFRIPEMKEIKTQYLKNDARIISFMDQYQEMYSAEDRLQTFVNKERETLADSLNVLLERRKQRSK